jgi:hypothetical protein
MSSHLQSLYPSLQTFCYQFSGLVIYVENQMSHEIYGVFLYLLQMRKTENTK